MIDGPFVNSPAMLDYLEAAWDRIHGAAVPAHLEQACVDCFAHPFFEVVARRILKADAVGLYHGVPTHARPPSQPPFAASWEQQWSGCHIDVQATMEDFEAVRAQTTHDRSAARNSICVCIGHD